jgi:tetratricopeptide (TPR) repeat protein
MPAHIDVLLGDYAGVIEANRKAIAADRRFVEREGRVNFYTLYRLHDLHFLVYGAMFDGQRALAAATAQELVGEIPTELLASIPDFIEAFVSTPLHVMVRFGRWDEILGTPAPPAEQPYTTAIWHYARAVALAALGRVDEARTDYDGLVAAAPRVPETRLMFNNSCKDLLEIAIAMAAGEIAYRRGETEEAFALLRRAVELDDALNYDEPWGWMQPARHALGALLLERDRVEEAETIYREDLARHPKNGWSLKGLSEALQRRGEAEQAAAIDAELASVWERADVPLTVSCYCRTGQSATTSG